MKENVGPGLPGAGGITGHDLPWTAEIAARFPQLSYREAEVCSLVARRLSTSEIARCLAVRPRTVEKHLENVFSKLDVQSREQLRFHLGVIPPRSGW